MPKHEICLKCPHSIANWWETSPRNGRVRAFQIRCEKVDVSFRESVVATMRKYKDEDKWNYVKQAKSFTPRKYFIAPDECPYILEMVI